MILLGSGGVYMKKSRQNEKVWELFQQLWTKAVHQQDYDKKEWLELESMLMEFVPFTVADSPGVIVRENQPFDEIERPAHYNFGQFEIIDVILDWGLNYLCGNVVKYVARAPHKGLMLKDLKKARWYLNKEIERIEANEDRITLTTTFPNTLQ